MLTVLLVVCGYVGGGCSGEVAEKGSAVTTPADRNTGIAIPVHTKDGKMLQPAGHTGLWFEREPEDPLDHLVWVSQRYVGLTIPVEPLGDRAWSPGGAHLPDVCAPAVVDRMVEMGFTEANKHDIGPEFVQCSVFEKPGGSRIGDIGFLWGSSKSIEVISKNEVIEGPDGWGNEFIVRGGLAEYFGCVAFRRSFSESGGVIAHQAGTINKASCLKAMRILQVIYNVLGGDLVQV